MEMNGVIFKKISPSPLANEIKQTKSDKNNLFA